MGSDRSYKQKQIVRNCNVKNYHSISHRSHIKRTWLTALKSYFHLGAKYDSCKSCRQLHDKSQTPQLSLISAPLHILATIIHWSSESIPANLKLINIIALWVSPMSCRQLLHDKSQTPCFHPLQPQFTYWARLYTWLSESRPANLKLYQCRHLPEGKGIMRKTEQIARAFWEICENPTKFSISVSPKA